MSTEWLLSSYLRRGKVEAGGGVGGGENVV